MPSDKSGEVAWDKEKRFWNPVSTPDKSGATTGVRRGSLESGQNFLESGGFRNLEN
jgi:hypothetical protein